MIDRRNGFDQVIKNDQITYDNIQKISFGQGDGYRIGCLLDYPYFKGHYKLTEIVLSKQQKLDVDPKAIQQINFTVNLEQDRYTQFFYLLKKQMKPF